LLPQENLSILVVSERGVKELLVRVVRITVPNLQFDAVDVVAVGDIEAFVSEDLDLAVLERPLLVRVTCASLDDNRLPVSVVDFETLGSRVSSCSPLVKSKATEALSHTLKQKLSGVCGRLRRDKQCARDKREKCGFGEHIWQAE
jgi:hypothetical protein